LSQYNVRFSSRYVQSLEKRAESLPGEINSLKQKLNSLPKTDNNYNKLEKEIAKKTEVLNETKEELKKWSKENFEKLSQYQKNLYSRAFTTNEGDADYHTLAMLKYEENGAER